MTRCLAIAVRRSTIHVL